MTNSLLCTTEATHRRLLASFEEVSVVSFPYRARDTQTRADCFLVLATRHVTAVRAVLASEVGNHLDSDRSRALVRASRELEWSLFRAKARMYGSQLMRVPWSEIWRRVQERFEAMATLEAAAVLALTETLPAGRLEELADQISRVEMRAPTRPHPRVPHAGAAGRVATAVLARADDFWDAVEGRIVPPCGSDRQDEEETPGRFAQERASR